MAHNPSNDPYLENAKKTYAGMMHLSKIAIAVTIAVLVGMALFLL
jgi:hypothetical protein